MDKLLKLKLEMVYKALPIEQARKHFEELNPKEIPESKKPKRKLRIPAKESK